MSLEGQGGTGHLRQAAAIAVAGYLAKYAIRSTKATGHLATRITTETNNSYRTYLSLKLRRRAW
jgi:hypothetical protein